MNEDKQNYSYLQLHMLCFLCSWYVVFDVVGRLFEILKILYHQRVQNAQKPYDRLFNHIDLSHNEENMRKTLFLLAQKAEK